MKSEAHNPTSAERDEKFSLYGLDPDVVGKVILSKEMVAEPSPKPRRQRKAKS